MSIQDKGTLYICPTPIGNLEDITLRALRTLKEVDLIAAEDTRRTLNILNYYDIKATLTSYHRHNLIKKGEYLQGLLLEGKNIALVSDAGTPGISDPGYELVKACIRANIPVVSLPGATAATTALVASGLATDSFFFQGFLPKGQNKRRDLLTELKSRRGTIIFYAPPHDLMGLLMDCKDIMGNRKGVLARELTKKYEEYIRGNLDKLIDQIGEKGAKGEYVLMLEGASDTEAEKENPWLRMDIGEHLLWNIKKGLTKKEAIALTARQRNIPKRLVYAESIEKK